MENKSKITFLEALKKAKEHNPKYITCEEHWNAWSFLYQDEKLQTPGIVIMKDDGRMLTPCGYYFSEIGEYQVIRKIDLRKVYVPKAECTWLQQV